MGFLDSIMNSLKGGQKKQELSPESIVGSLPESKPSFGPMQEAPQPESYRPVEPYKPVDQFRPSMFDAPKPPMLEGSSDSVKAKLELISAQIDSIKIQYDTMNERVLQIEKMVRELLRMARGV